MEERKETPVGPFESTPLIRMTKYGIPTRYAMAFLAFFGFLFNYMLRINISVAIVAMVTSKVSLNGSNSTVVRECSSTFNFDNSTDNQNDSGEFDWNEKTQSIIIGSFFWGYILTQIPGGRLAELFGAKHIFGWAILLSGLVNIAIPFVADSNPIYLICLRVLLGVFQGPTYPAMHSFLSRWMHPLESSRITSIVYSGSQAGTILAFPLAGFITANVGWQWVFFSMGAASLIWSFFWLLLVHDTPSTHPRISIEERSYLEEGLKKNLTPFSEVPILIGVIYLSYFHSAVKKKVPLKAILTSMPFWAILIAGMSSGWGFWTLLIQLPTYMKNILHFDIKKNSLLSALPYTVMWIFGLSYSSLVDFLRRRQFLTTGHIRKISTVLCLFAPALVFISITFIGCDPIATVVLLTLGVGMVGAKYSAYLVNHIDIAPNFAGTLMGITNTMATIPGWLAPLVAGALTNGEQTLEQWHKVFYITASIHVFGCFFYLAFGSGEIQPWNKEKEETQRENETRPQGLSFSAESVNVSESTKSTISSFVDEKSDV